MRKGLAVVIAAALAACGGSSKSDGGGGAGTSLTVTGPAPMAGTLTDATSLITQSQSCTAGAIGVTMSFALLGFSTASSCSAFRLARDPANADVGAVALVRFKIGSNQSVPLSAGTYTFWDGSSVPPFDAQGIASAFLNFGFARNGAAAAANGCQPVAQASVTGGTVTVTAASANGVTGSVNLQLSNGGAVTGSFDAPACAVPISLDASCEPTGLPSSATCG
jgi:hypothetical protein